MLKRSIFFMNSLVKTECLQEMSRGEIAHLWIAHPPVHLFNWPKTHCADFGHIGEQTCSKR